MRVAAFGISALVIGLLVAPAAAAPDASRNILVFAGNNNPRVVAKINRLSCKKARKSGRVSFIAKGADGGWKLALRVNRFDGYHDYDIEYGIRRVNFELDPPGRNGFYANFFFPGDTPPPLSGNLKLAPRGRKVGISFPAAFSARTDDAVALAGNAKCA